MGGTAGRCKAADLPVLPVVSCVLSNTPVNPDRLRVVGTALAQRNAVAAEMAVAGRAHHDPADPAWAFAAESLAGQIDACAWGDEAGSATRSARDGGRTRAHAHAVGPAAAGVAVLAYPLRPEAPTHGGQRPRKAAARRRRELLEVIFWFVVGGAGAVGVLAAVRGVDAVLR